MNDRIDCHVGDQGPVWVAADHLLGDNFFHHHDHMAGAERGFFLHPHQPPELGIAHLITALSVDDGYIRVESRHDRNRAAAVRIFDTGPLP
jgi:hypothetical protein